MTISLYIAKLEAIRKEHGDIEVETYSYKSVRVTPRSPEVAFRKVLRGREKRPEFWFKYDEEDSRRGEKVVRI